MDSRELMQETRNKNNYFYDAMYAFRNNKVLIENSEYKDIEDRAKKIANNQLRIYNGIMETINTLKLNGADDNEIKNYEELANRILRVFEPLSDDSYLYIEEIMDYNGKQIPIAYYKKSVDWSILIKNAIDKTAYKFDIDALVNGGSIIKFDSMTSDNENNVDKQNSGENIENEDLNDYFRQAIIEGYWLSRYNNNFIDDFEYELRNSNNFDKEYNLEISDFGIKIGMSLEMNIRNLREKISTTEDNEEKEKYVYLLAMVKEVFTNSNLTINDIVEVGGYYVNKLNEDKVKKILNIKDIKENNNDVSFEELLSDLENKIKELNNEKAKNKYTQLLDEVNKLNSISEKQDMLKGIQYDLDNNVFGIIPKDEEKLREVLNPIFNYSNINDFTYEEKELFDKLSEKVTNIANINARDYYDNYLKRMNTSSIEERKKLLDEMLNDLNNNKYSMSNKNDVIATANDLSSYYDKDKSATKTEEINNIDGNEEEFEVKDIKSNIKENDNEQEKQRKITMRKLIKYGAIAILAIGLSQYLIIPAFMQVNSLLWAANPGMHAFYHGLNNILGGLINATYTPATGVWTSMTGHSINAMLSTQSIYTSLLSSIAGIGTLKVGIDFINKITKNKSVENLNVKENKEKLMIEESEKNSRIKEQEETLDKQPKEEVIEEISNDEIDNENQNNEIIDSEEIVINENNDDIANVEHNEDLDDNKTEKNDEFDYDDTLASQEKKLKEKGYSYMPIWNNVKDDEKYVFKTQYDPKTGVYYYYKVKPRMTTENISEKKNDLKERLYKIKEVLGGAAEEIKNNTLNGINDIKNAFNNNYGIDEEDEYEEDKLYNFNDKDVEFVTPKRQTTTVNYDNPIEEMRLISDQIASAYYDYGLDTELVNKAKRSIQRNLFDAEVAYNQGDLDQFNKYIDETLDVIDSLFINTDDKSVRNQYMEALYMVKDQINKEAHTR